MEHITMMDAVKFVESCDEGYIAATVTPQHLLLNRNLSFKEDCSLTITAFLFSRNPQTGNCVRQVEVNCSTHIFGTLRRVEREGGARQARGTHKLQRTRFLRASKNSSKIKLTKSPWKVPESFPYESGHIIPMSAGDTLEWLPCSISLI